MNYKEILEGACAQISANNLEGREIRVQKLAGDASLRKYFRLHLNDKSYVLMLTEPFDAKSYDFLLVQNFLQVRGIPVPKVLVHDGGRGSILLEDLGDRTMLHELGDRPEKELELFQSALQLLVDFHEKTKAKEQPKPVPGFGLAFDEEKLLWEVDFTLEHLFGSYLKRSIPQREFGAIRDSFVDICRRLAAEPRVFTHRDYHSRNLMLDQNNKLVCIDFQDARMGLRAYDLASILRDSYYQLSEERVYELVDFYLGKVGEKLEKKHFVKMFDLMSIQRNFKAIGSFTSFYGKRSDPMYIRFVGNTFENIRRNLAKFPEYKETGKLLFRYYYF